MTFGQAIEYLELGNEVFREGWNGKGIFIKLQVPDKNSFMTEPYIYIDTMGLENDNAKMRIPWLASQSDMLAVDWQARLRDK